MTSARSRLTWVRELPWICHPERITHDSEVSQVASPLMYFLARTIAVEESVTGH